ncbi:hypothetical protein N0V86_006903 [Didymella sp. IMI 355093]|nr:hypothetical protein N0V86_006903 [Didymella sp. IMI 355093]
MYKLTVSQDAWPSKNDRPTELSSPLELGRLTYAAVNIGSSDGANLPSVRLDVLDQLCDIINANLRISDPDALLIDSLYTSTLNLAEGPSSQTRSTHYITFTRAALVMSLADQSSTGWNLTFKAKLQSDLVLPMVFSEIVVFPVEGDSVPASVFEFNTSMRGGYGHRHAAQLTPADGSQDLATSSPEELPTLDILNVQDLILLPGYSDEKLQSLSQQEYILNQKDRPKITPEQLPGSMAEELNDRDKGWFHDVYGPAFVANAISRADPETLKQWDDKLSVDERLKVRYWFSGRLATKEAMYYLLPGVRDFTREPQYWADKLDAVVRDPDVIRSLQRTKVSNGIDYANKVANLIRVLDVDHAHTHTQMDTSLAGSITAALQNPYLLKSAENTARTTGWVTDSIRLIIISVLSDEDVVEPLDISNDMRKSIREDLTKFEEEYGLSSTGPALERANAFLKVLQDAKFLDRLSENLSPLPEASSDNESIRDAGMDLDDDDEAILNNVEKTTWGSALEGFDDLWHNQYSLVFGTSSDSSRAATAKGVVSIAYIAFKINDAFNGFVDDFEDKSGDQQAAVVFKTTSKVVSVFKFARKAWLMIRDPVKTLDELRETWLFRKVAETRVGVEVGKLMSTLVTEIRLAWTALTSDPTTLAVALARRISPLTAPTAASRALVKVGAASGVGDILRVANGNSLEAGALSKSGFALNVAGKSFGMARIALETATAVLAIAVVITSALSLAREWDTMSDPARVLSVLSLTVSTLAIFTGEVFVGSVVAALEVSNAVATAAVNAAPIVGQVLAAIGVVIGVVLAIVQALYKPKADPPPPDHVAMFIEDDFKEVVRDWGYQPDAELDVSLDPTTVPEKDQLGLLQLTVTSKSSNSRLLMDRVTFSFRSGFKPASLFKNTQFHITDDPNDRAARDQGSIFVDGFSSENPCRVICTSSVESKGEHENDSSQYSYATRIIVTGVPRTDNPRGTLDFPPRGMFRLNIAGIGRGDGVANLEVVEEYEHDSVYHDLDVKV